jgi:hypothetical protein
VPEVAPEPARGGPLGELGGQVELDRALDPAVEQVLDAVGDVDEAGPRGRLVGDGRVAERVGLGDARTPQRPHPRRVATVALPASAGRGRRVDAVREAQPVVVEVEAGPVHDIPGEEARDVAQGVRLVEVGEQVRAARDDVEHRPLAPLERERRDLGRVPLEMVRHVDLDADPVRDLTLGAEDRGERELGPHRLAVAPSRTDGVGDLTPGEDRGPELVHLDRLGEQGLESARAAPDDVLRGEPRVPLERPVDPDERHARRPWARDEHRDARAVHRAGAQLEDVCGQVGAESQRSAHPHLRRSALRVSHRQAPSCGRLTVASGCTRSGRVTVPTGHSTVDWCFPRPERSWSR